MDINICHLYPDLLNLYGDRGNITALSKRCTWRNIAVNVTDISINDSFDSEKYDIIFLGGGQDYEQEILANDILIEKATEIKNAIKHDKTFLCICGGYQMLGAYYKNQLGKEIEFLNAIDIYTEAGKKRMIGNTVYDMDIPGIGRVVGFENHSGKTYLKGDVKPLATVIKGHGNNSEDKTEGAIYRNVFCSYSHGALLPKNPKLTDHILTTALSQKYSKDMHLENLDDSLENRAHNSVEKMILERNA